MTCKLELVEQIQVPDALSYLDVLNKNLEYKSVPEVEEELLLTDSQEHRH